MVPGGVASRCGSAPKGRGCRRRPTSGPEAKPRFRASGQRARRPTTSKVPVNERVDTVLGWLSEERRHRPRFVTLYLETLDDAGHGSWTGLGGAADGAARGRRRHGTARRRSGGALAPRRGQYDHHRRITVWRRSRRETPSPSRTWWIRGRGGGDDRAVRRLQPAARPRTRGATRGSSARTITTTAGGRSDLPKRWHYGTPSAGAGDRLPDARRLGCRAARGARETAAGRDARIARFRPGAAVDAGDLHRPRPVVSPWCRGAADHNVDIYPLLMSLLGLEPAPNDGDPRALAGALTASAPARAR